MCSRLTYLLQIAIPSLQDKHRQRGAIFTEELRSTTSRGVCVTTQSDLIIPMFLLLASQWTAAAASLPSFNYTEDKTVASASRG